MLWEELSCGTAAPIERNSTLDSFAALPVRRGGSKPSFEPNPCPVRKKWAASDAPYHGTPWHFHLRSAIFFVRRPISGGRRYFHGLKTFADRYVYREGATSVKGNLRFFAVRRVKSPLAGANPFRSLSLRPWSLPLHRPHVVLSWQLPYPACHFQLEKRGKHLGRGELRLQQFENPIDLQTLVRVENLEDHGFLRP